MTKLATIAALAATLLTLGACGYMPEGDPPQVNALAPVTPVRVATCADSFNAALNNLTMAMERQSTSTQSLPMTAAVVQPD